MKQVKLKNVLAILGLAAAIGACGPGMAQDTGFYIGAGLGQAKIDIDCTGATSCDDKDNNWKIFGGYQFNKYLAFELGYIDAGEISASGPTPPFGTSSLVVETTLMEMVVVGFWPFADRFSVYGKLGVYRADTDVTASNTVLGSLSESDSNTGPTFGVGVRFDILRNLAVRLEWQRYDNIEAGDFGEADADAIGVGLQWKF